MKQGNIAFFVPHAGCPHRCSFCDQRVISGSTQMPTPAQVRTLLQSARAQVRHPEESEIAFFGGSFTAIDRALMIGLLEAAYPFTGNGGFYGIRISTRPDCIDADTLSLLARYRVTAIELGAQSMVETVLRLNGRGHTAMDVRRASALIKQGGFSLGLQMMTGLYGDDDAGAYDTARELIRLHPDTVRIYPTVVLQGTDLARYMQEGLYTPPDIPHTTALCAGLLTLFARWNIQVIRLGLHASRDVEERLVGGAYHPALRDLCEGEQMLHTACTALNEQAAGSYVLFVRPQDVSRMIGQKRKNLDFLRGLGYDVTVKKRDGALPMSVTVEPCGL